MGDRQVPEDHLAAGLPGETMGDATGTDGDRSPGPVRRLWSDRRYRFVALGVVVVLVATTGWFLWRDDRAETVPEAAGQATSPAQAGLGYLTALADGRSADVSAYLKVDPGALVSMSDPVLAASSLINPITDIVVLDTEQQDDEGTVTVRYQFGDQRVIDTYQVTRHGKYWKLADGYDDPQGSPGYVEIDWALDAVRDQLAINDVALPADEPLRLWPGTYRIGSTNSLLTSDDVLVVPALSTPATAVARGRQYSPALALTDAGRQQVTQAVQTTIDTCLQETQPITSCGLRLPSYLGSRTPVESSLRWTIDPGSVDIASTGPVIASRAQADPTTSDWVPGLWACWNGDSLTAVGAVEFTNGETQTYDDRLHSYAVDVSDPDSLVVVLQWMASGIEARRGS